MRIRKSVVFVLSAAIIAGVGYALWQPAKAAAAMAVLQSFVGQWTRPADPPAGFAKTHGRIEATRVMITTKLAGKIQEVLVREGDTVDAGQVVARMDTRSLKAQFRKAEAQVQKARDAKNTAAAVVAERESELTVATQNFAAQERASSDRRNEQGRIRCRSEQDGDSQGGPAGSKVAGN